MKIFQTPSYDRFCLFEMERKSKDFRGMDGNVAYKNKLPKEAMKSEHRIGGYGKSGGGGVFK